MSSKPQQESLLGHKSINSGQAQHLRSMDSKIRKKWNLLYCYRKGRVPQHQQDSFLVHKLTTQPTCSPKNDPLQLQHLKSNKNREATSLRIKKNDEIFFGKKSNFSHSQQRKPQRLRTAPNQISEFVLDHSRNDRETDKASMDKLPLMLQKRGKKVEKEMAIIEHLSAEKIKRLKERQTLKMQLNRQEQNKLIDKMKGTKLYYKFVQEWNMPLYDDPGHQQQQTPKHR